MSEVAEAFGAMSEADFEAKYDFKRPQPTETDKLIVMSCKAGPRAKQAASKMASNGYDHLAIYSGSFNDWEAKGGKVLSGVNDSRNLVDFQQMKFGLEDQSLTVIDVRNPNERVDPGHIPGTYNVPRNF